MTERFINLIKTVIVAALILFLSAMFLFAVVPVKKDQIEGSLSLRILSGSGTLLRQFPSGDDESYRRSLAFEDYPDYLIKAVLTAEDRRFYYHSGFDLIAAVRAAVNNLRNRRIVSGASTITQQLAKIIWNNELPEQRFLRKLTEILYAFRLELWLSKKEILECYLNRVPLRYNQSGFAAEAVRIFGKDVRYLTKEEMISLAVLVRRNAMTREEFSVRFYRMWKKLETDDPERMEETADRIFNGNSGSSSGASDSARHFEMWLKGRYPGLRGNVLTTIDENLNASITEIINNELKFLEAYDTENAAVIVISLHGEKSLPVVAMVGSRDFYAVQDGQVNGTVSVREAGSTLKPFIYALAMDRKGLTPNSIVDDIETGFPGSDGETYYPRNYDLAFWGPMTLREALGASRNVPAVKMLEIAGVRNFRDFLRRAGFSHLNEPAGYYGYGLALGTGGTTLLQLAQLYTIFPKQGLMYPLKIGTDSRGRELLIGKRRRLLSEKSCHYVTDILNDRDVRRRSNGDRNFQDFPFDCASKTGTSKDFRDAWTVGFTKDYAVAVWAGNFSGKPMRRVSGAWGSGRIFQQVVRKLTGDSSPRFICPDNFIEIRLCRKSGLPAREDCPFYTEHLDPSDIPVKKCTLKHTETASETNDIPEIISPVQNEIFVIDPLSDPDSQGVPVRIVFSKNSKDRYFWSVDGGEARELKGDVNDVLIPVPGEHRVSVFNDTGLYKVVRFRVE